MMQEDSTRNEETTPSSLRDRIVWTLRTVYDPEIPVNIYDIGLVYELTVDEDGRVGLTMTLTSPSCPVAESLPAEVQQRVRSVSGVKELDFELTWDPPWTMERMSEEAKLQLGLV